MMFRCAKSVMPVGTRMPMRTPRIPNVAISWAAFGQATAGPKSLHWGQKAADEFAAPLQVFRTPAAEPFVSGRRRRPLLLAGRSAHCENHHRSRTSTTKCSSPRVNRMAEARPCPKRRADRCGPWWMAPTMRKKLSTRLVRTAMFGPRAFTDPARRCETAGQNCRGPQFPCRRSPSTRPHSRSSAACCSHRPRAGPARNWDFPTPAPL